MLKLNFYKMNIKLRNIKKKKLFLCFFKKINCSRLYIKMNDIKQPFIDKKQERISGIFYSYP